MGWWVVSAAVLIALGTLTSCQNGLLTWISMSDNAVTLAPGDDAAQEIVSPIGFPFGDSLRHNIYVTTNGLISFEVPVTSWFNVPFPSFLANFYVIAPFWDDANTNNGGTISFDIYEGAHNDTRMDIVSAYVTARTGTPFEGYWMMVVLWDQVRPFSFFGSTGENTFQAVLIMDSDLNSYAIFIYECGLLEWDNFATIGYNAGPEHYDNHDPSGNEIACINYPANNFSNVFYALHEAQPLPTVPPQASYLDFLQLDSSSINYGFLQMCDDCVSEPVDLGTNFPFGNYYHDSLFVASNGHISFHTGYTHFNAELLPTGNPSIYWDFIVAPFWSDIDLRLEGTVSWDIITRDQDQQILDQVSTHIQQNYNGASTFSGEWMMVIAWNDVHPFPHGVGSTTPYSLSTNSFQAILITDGTKSYAVYTYRCGQMEWGDESTIGFNAGGDYYENHPITGHFQSHYVSCLQNISNGNLITNVIYDLVPNTDDLLPGTIPPTHNTIGSCEEAEFTECCEEGDCRGLPLFGSCYCDALCSNRGDCCYDQQFICPTGLLTDDYLILALETEILHMSLNGSNIETLEDNVNERVYGIDYHIANGIMVWSDIDNDVIYQKRLDGVGSVTQLVTTNIASVDDIAIDWIGNNLYWADAVWSRIEVMNLDNQARAEVLRTSPNYNPRAIAVDPTTRFMFWSELGQSGRILRASMDGTAPQLLAGTFIQPNGLTVDVGEQRLYWCDTMINTIVYATLSPLGLTNIVSLQLNEGTLGSNPFALSVSSTSLFWTDIGSNRLLSTHKVHGEGDAGNLATVYSSSFDTPRGVEVVSSSQQPVADNPCNMSGCSQICMLSTNTNGFTCECGEGFELGNDGLTCEEVSTPSPTAPPEGSCADAGYSTCCQHGTCGGNPANCFCDVDCYTRLDCCSDMYTICNEVPPLAAVSLNLVMELTTARVSFTILQLINGDESYWVNYGLTQDLGLQTLPIAVTDPGDYFIDVEDLSSGLTYYFRLSGRNDYGTTVSGILSNTTLEDAPSGPPQSFQLTATGTTLSASWQPPLTEERNGIISSYTLNCNGLLTIRLNPVTSVELYGLDSNLVYSCRIAAWTSVGIGPYSNELSIQTEDSDTTLNILPWVTLGVNYGSTQQFLPATDDGFEGPISIPLGFRFGSSVQTQVFVGTNGLISFETGFNSFSNQQFPGNTATQDRYLVAPFWDDVDIRFDTGDISYEIHESGYYLDKVNTFIQQTRPTQFQGTWMMVVFYDSVHPYFGLFNSLENSFQVILITDGTYSYTIFTYQCGFMAWDNTATIGYNAAGEMFANHNPSTSAVACLNSPDSVWSNILYRLSNVTNELPPPTNVEALNITLNSSTIQWVVTRIDDPQTYTVVFGTDENSLTSSLPPISSSSEGGEQMYQAVLEGLVSGTIYYVQVQSSFGIYTLRSDVISFEALETAIEIAPSDFQATATGTSVRFTWSGPFVSQTVVAVNLLCYSGADLIVNIEVKNIGDITLYDLPPETNLSCSLAAASSGGYGPPTPNTYVLTEDAVEADSYFSFLPMDIHINFEQLFFPGTDDGYYGPVEVPGGFPFGDTVQTGIYIGSNGILSLGNPYNSFLNQELPVPEQVIVAPFWDDVDTRFGSGIISFEVQDSGYFLEEVSEFIRRRRSALSFTGSWMLIVYWEAVHPYFGIFNDLENTFQAILITDGTYSYSLFTYQCDLMEWDNGVTIGYSDGGDFFFNNVPSSSEVACLNLPVSNISNIIYRLSSASPEIPPPENVNDQDISISEVIISWTIPEFTVQEEYLVEYGFSPTELTFESNVTTSIDDTSVTGEYYEVILTGLTAGTKYYYRVVARFGVGNVYVRHTNVFAFLTQSPPQNMYLQFLQSSPTSYSNGQLLPCQHCSSSEILFPSVFPFGGYFHRSAYVSVDGLITFGQPLIQVVPENFPPTDSDAFWTYIVAPFWADYDTTMGGLIFWEIHQRQSSPALLQAVDNLIGSEYGDTSFEGEWMLVAFWNSVPSDLPDGNTFQAILTTNGTKSYAVSTYHCGDLEWSGPATIGFYAPTTSSYVHPLSEFINEPAISTAEIACIHGSEWSNLIFELEVNNHILEMTPEPHFSTGSCVEAGLTTCCTGFACSFDGCFCDQICHLFGDCCFDIDQICPGFGEGSAYDILVGHGDHISQIHFEGTSSETVRTNTTGTVVGVDYLYSTQQMFWSDITTDQIHRANLDGSEEEILVSSCISVVDDIAVDWVSNKLYWTDSYWKRIEAIDLSNTSIRVEVLATGGNSVPRAIAVDPINRRMFWTDYGVVAKIETAAMDGAERRTLHYSEISQPNGITIDYTSNRIYWSDSELDRLEYSGFDGSGRSIVESGSTGLVHPFSVTVADTILFWSDWSTNKIYATHKEHGNLEDQGFFIEIVTFLDTPYGIEALQEARQPAALENPCLNSVCSHMCLLTFANESGFSCACPEGYEFENSTFCKVSEGPSTSCQTTPGLCATQHSICCEGDFCAGSPANCFCDADCRLRGDCCSDIDDTCTAGSPRLPRNISVIENTGTTVTISFLIPYIVSGPETYTISYGLSMNNLNLQQFLSSGSNTSVVDVTYTRVLLSLTYLTQYYFTLRVANEITSVTTEVFTFTTAEGAPSAAPTDFAVDQSGTAVCLSWEPPPEDQLNGVLVSYTLTCESSSDTYTHIVKPHIRRYCFDTRVGSQQLSCSMAASTGAGTGPDTPSYTVTTASVDSGLLEMFVLNSTFGVDRTIIPTSDDGTFGPIDLPEYGFPFWSGDQERVYIAVNGLLSFGQPYGSFFNQQFPGSFFISNRFLVAPFWDDANTNRGGEISYEIHTSGYPLDYMSAFIRSQRPSLFQGTWMMVVFYDRVPPYSFSSIILENTYQTVIITDGSSTYTIFTYDCNLMEWGTSATIGFNAGSDGVYENNEYTTSAIACSNLPFANTTNVIYRLSENSEEFAVPTNIIVTNIERTSATVQWVVPSVIEQQSYTILYGTSPQNLDDQSSTVLGDNDITLTDQTYSIPLQGLEVGTTYYFIIRVTFGEVTLTTDVNEFRTLDEPPTVAPQVTNVTVDRLTVTIQWNPPPNTPGLLSYTIVCSVSSVEVFTAVLKPIQEFKVEELDSAATYGCTILASTSGGPGPLAILTFTTEDILGSYYTLQFVTMNTLLGVEETVFDGADESTEGPFDLIGGGFPFGSTRQTQLWISTNALLSFGTAYNTWSNQQFPGSSSINFRYLVAPFWDDIDTRYGGVISYEIHEEGYYLDQVNKFLQFNRPSMFEGTWMMVILYQDVRPYFGLFNNVQNTFQAILVSDGVYSYAIFTYNCGLMGWNRSPTIGYNAGGEHYANHDPASSAVACLNTPVSDYYNAIYLLSNESPEIPPPGNVQVTDVTTTSARVSWTIPSFITPEQYYVAYGTDPNDLTLSSNIFNSPDDTSITDWSYTVVLTGLQSGIVYFIEVRAFYDTLYVRYTASSFITREPEQTAYLQLLSAVNPETLDPCDDCSSGEITIPSDFPFGGYYHQTAYVSTNGLISFGQEVTTSNPVLFPSTIASIAQSYIVAPFWADFDTSNDGGTVSWWIVESGDSLTAVSEFIRDEYGNDNFEATWMLVADWDIVTPAVNKFQAILVTDGAKSYAVFTYTCDELMWSDPATIGFNAPNERSFNHPLSGTDFIDAIACVHSLNSLNNVIYELETNAVILPVTPVPNTFLGSCVDAGFTECCTGFFCWGSVFFECYCDSFCYITGDCCPDIEETCPEAGSFDVLVGHGHHISLVHYEGESTETLRTNTSGTVVGVDYHEIESKIYWSDVTTDTIHRADMDGTNEEMLVDTYLIAVDDIAVDWVSGKLYWTDAGWARIEVMDLDSLIRIELLRTGDNTAPRAIAVDPIRRVMYWTDWGSIAKIEIASMDGSERRDFVIEDLSQPNGISIDFGSNRVYWSDASLDKLEFISFDGTGRTQVQTETTGLQHPFAVSVGSDILFWSDWDTNSIYVTHKEHGADDSLGYFAPIATFSDTPYGVEALLPGRQPSGENRCSENNCSHVCLLSEIADDGYTCACPLGYELDTPILCKVSGGSPTPTPLPDGTCAAAEYEYCCQDGLCVGYPPTCFCDSDCRLREDCCIDIDTTCNAGSPLGATDIQILQVTATTAFIRWTIENIVSNTESYYITYGLSQDSLTDSTEPQLSGQNITMQYYATLSGLDPLETYYFRVISSNQAGLTATVIRSFTTDSGPPSGPPLDFTVAVVSTAMMFSWSPPELIFQNGEITSYTLECIGAGRTWSVTTTEFQFTIDTFIPGASFQCSVLATNNEGDGPTSTLIVTTPDVAPGTPGYLPLLSLGPNRVILPPADDGISNAIPLTGFPFWSTNRSTVYVATNGLLSFDSAYGSWNNVLFPGFVSSRYLVAPFWDDADTRFGNGEISYEIYDNGYILEYVSAFVRRTNPSEFEGTWMMAVTWDSIRPYHSFFSTQENTYQAILITDGTSSYTVFTYDCSLMGWGNSATIGFNAGEENYENNLYTDSSIACKSLPASNITNVAYRLSDSTSEYPPPQNVLISDIDLNSVTVSWVVPSTPAFQQYTIQYGLEPNVFDLSSGLISSREGINQQYSTTVDGLIQGTDYYLRVSSTFDYNVIYSDVVTFTTLDPPPTGPPENFVMLASGTILDLSWEQPRLEERGGVIRYYTLTCTSDDDGPIGTFQLNNVTRFSLNEYRANVPYSCTLSASTSGGPGPTASAEASTTASQDAYLPFIRAGSLRDMESMEFEEVDDGSSEEIQLTTNFPFGNSTQNSVFVGTNGIISFGEQNNPFSNSPFTETSFYEYVIAPFWDDINIFGGNGRIFYEIHEDGYFLDKVNKFLQYRRPSTAPFVGTQMLVAYWDAVHPFSFSIRDLENTFEAILITDGTYSYTVFTYQCGLLNWDSGVTIGFKGADDFFANHDPSTSQVACLNSPTSDYSNIIYLLSLDSREIPVPDTITNDQTTTSSTSVLWIIPSFTTQEQYYIQYGTDRYNLTQRSDLISSTTDTSSLNVDYTLQLSGLEPSTIYFMRVVAQFGGEDSQPFNRRQSEIASFRTKEEEQASYLEYIDIDGQTVMPCVDGCSSPEIALPYNFPFGGYYHQNAYVSTNGLITFGQSFTDDPPQLFPLEEWGFIVAPFWQNFNTTMTGSVTYRVYQMANESESAMVSQVNTLIKEEQMDTDFDAIWMLGASWNDIPVEGDSNTNKFQAFLISNGTKSYAVFTYNCMDVNWSGPFEIGYQAPPTYFYNHPLSFGEFEISELACAHENSLWNNIIVDLQPGNTILPITPAPPQFSGSCRAAGYDDCCVGGGCTGSPPNCYCDFFCIFFGDCCFDATQTCHAPTFDILVGNGDHLSKIHFEGTAQETVLSSSSANIVGVDYHALRSLIFWSDTDTDTINQANMDGSNSTVLVSTDIRAVDDIAMDWIANNLYWVDSVWVRIEAINIDSLERAEIVRVGANSRPRAIAVDPINRVMFWTDWGLTPQIERANMDGSDRTSVISAGLSQPNGITIDYATQKIYWTDSDLDKIEYSNYDGTDRILLESIVDGILHPFGITIVDELLFWTDWETNYLYYTHKDHGNTDGLGLFVSLAHFTSTPHGIEALSNSRQNISTNPCSGHDCDHICLLSPTSSGYTCGCAAGNALQNDDKTCQPTTQPEQGSCIEANYPSCCSHGFCAGYPATCSCNPDCHDLGDCCEDITATCSQSYPRLPEDVQVLDTTHFGVKIQWRIPSIAFSAETYTLFYGETEDNLTLTAGEPQFSGTNLAVENQIYSVNLINLSPGTTYYYRIRLENTYGPIMTTVAQFNTPFVGAPQNFTIQPIGPEMLKFSWGLPPGIDVIEQIDFFVIDCEPTFLDDIQVDVQMLEITLTEFLPGTTYTCTVRAKRDELGSPAVQTATTPEAENLLPFLFLGTTDGVQKMTLPPSDSANSAPIYIPAGFPIGATTQTTAYVGTDGIITFGSPFGIYFPSLFPTANFFISNSYVIAPFWSDVDTRLAGSVSYETYERGQNQASNAVLGRISGFISAQMNVNFTGSWMLLAHWEKVHPYSHGDSAETLPGPYLDFLNSENSFQAIVITDGSLNYAMYTYKCNLLEWSGYEIDKYAVIGTNTNGNYQNHPLSGTEDAVQIACLSDESSGWYNLIYPLPQAVDPIQQLIAECYSSEVLDIDINGDIVPLSISLGVCPPTIGQALVDFRFVFTGDVGYSGSLCFSHVFPAGITGSSSLICCYTPASNVAPGSLVVGGLQGSSIAIYHPTHFDDGYVQFDKNFRETCCSAGLCNIFHARRSIANSIYLPPFFAWGLGDPHITTLDGKTYTFNGRGEYTLVEYRDVGFVLQGRTEPVSNTSNATQFSAFALGIKDEGLFSEVRLSRDRLVTFINGEDISSQIQNVNDTTNEASFYVTRVANNSIRILFYKNPLAYVFTVSLRDNILEFVLNLDRSLNGSTRGLFGNFNSNDMDDFILPNGVTIQANASDEMLHDFGQAWQIVEPESLFTYPAGMSTADYSFPDHIPPFLDQVVASAPSEIVTQCAGNKQCIFDAVQTGNPQIGTDTLDTINSNTEDVMTANNFPPMLSGLTTFRVIVGSTSSYIFTAVDTDDVVVTIEGPPASHYTLIQNGNSYTLNFLVSSVFTYETMIVAMDTMDVASTLNPRVEICACQNGGNCTLDGIITQTSNVVDMLCMCTSAYDGRYCENDANGCADVECFNEVQCYDAVAPESGAVCGACPGGYEGDGVKCTDVDECSPTNDCGQICVNTPGDFRCDCEAGYALTADDTSCSDIDECALELDGCQVCTNTDGSFMCSCREGFELDNDGFTCTALNPCTTPCSNGQCARVNNADVCVCNNGYMLNNGICSDIDECQLNLCEEKCENTAGFFECSCNEGYTLRDDMRTCEDTDECVQLDNIRCTGNQRCLNNDGSFECTCPAGTMLESGICVVMDIVEPTVVPIPTETPVVDSKEGRANSVNVTLSISKEEFDSNKKFRFKIDLSYQVNKYCASNEKECGGVVNTSPNDVVILDEIVNDANGNATFFVFVYTKQPDEVLSGKVLEKILSNLDIVGTVAPFEAERGDSRRAISGGGIAAIVIVLVLVVAVVVILTAVLILIQMNRIPKPRMPPMMSNLSMDIFRSRDRRSSMLIEEGYDGESMRDTVSVSGDVAEAKAKEAEEEEKEEEKKEEPKEEVKVDLAKEAEETV